MGNLVRAEGEIGAPVTILLVIAAIWAVAAITAVMLCVAARRADDEIALEQSARRQPAPGDLAF
jgi:hypothetical protein